MELYGASPPELFGALWSSPEFSFLIETFTGLMFRNTYESLQIVSLSFLISSERLPSPSWTQNNDDYDVDDDVDINYGDDDDDRYHSDIDVLIPSSSLCS